MHRYRSRQQARLNVLAGAERDTGSRHTSAGAQNARHASASQRSFMARGSSKRPVEHQLCAERPRAFHRQALRGSASGSRCNSLVSPAVVRDGIPSFSTCIHDVNELEAEPPAAHPEQNTHSRLLWSRWTRCAKWGLSSRSPRTTRRSKGGARRRYHVDRPREAQGRPHGRQAQRARRAARRLAQAALRRRRQSGDGSGGALIVHVRH